MAASTSRATRGIPSCISSRLQFGRSLSLSHRARHGDVRQFVAIDRAAQQQSAAAHVPAPDEIRWKTQPFPKMREENIDIFSRGDASQQNNFRVCRQFFRESLDRAFEGFAIARIVFIDVDGGELAQII